MALTPAEKQRRYRQRKSNAKRNEMVTRVTEPEQGSVTEANSVTLPPVDLPDDDMLVCNKDIGWDDIMALTREEIDRVYRVHLYYASRGDDILVRLRRAAGYKLRVAC